MKVGNSRMQAFYKSLGFDAPVPVELPERGAPLYPSPWRDITTLTTSFGHGIAVSPLHVLRATAGLVNGGMMPAPTLVLRDTAETPAATRIVSESTSRHLRQLMELVVAAGTGNNAYVEGYNVGGKTGTAEKNQNGRYNQKALLSSFLGAFPINNPRYVVLAIMDEPHGLKETGGYATGGWTAAPVVARVIEQMAPLYQMEPDTRRGRKDIAAEMAPYLKETKTGGALAAVGTDR